MSNPHCECAGPGWCQRHQLNKSETMWNHCQLARQGSIKYWRAWEQGRLGATQPDEPQLFQRGAGDRVANAIQRVSRGAVRPCGGCKKRQGRLNFLFPGRKYPELTATPIEWDNCTRNLLYYIWPVAGNDVWRWNLSQLRQHLGKFNGRKIITVATDGTTVSTRDVDDYLGDPSIEIISVRNNKKLRESAHWINALSHVDTLDPLQITFCGHAKGVRIGWSECHGNARQHVTLRWAEVAYQAALSQPHLVCDHLSRYAMTGPFKRYGQFTTKANHRWHYSGTFYWFRNRDVFQRNWMHVDKRFFGTESWPGYLFKPDETGCLFLDECGDPYNVSYWRTTIEPAWSRWLEESPA